jgi:hypothetical protein
MAAPEAASAAERTDHRKTPAGGSMPAEPRTADVSQPVTDDSIKIRHLSLTLSGILVFG